MKKRITAYLIFALLGLLHLPALGQGGSETVVKGRGHISATAIRPGDKFKIAVVLDVADGYHINAHVPSLDYLIATRLQFTPPPGITVGQVTYPAPDYKSFTFSPDTKLAVHEGVVIMTAEAEASSTLKADSVAIAAKVIVQSCNNEACLAPTDIEIGVPVQIVARGAKIQEANADLFAQAAASNKARPSEESSGELQEFQGSGKKKDDLGELIAASGLPLALLTVFLAGLALNLTPCVYPIIPITIGFFVNQAASQGGKSRLSRTFLMASMYVLGMAITYSILGVVASMTGGLFGAALQSPLVLIGLAIVMAALALSMFGVYEFRVPEFLNRFANKSTQSTSGVLGALVMGLTMGIVAAPCIGPFVLGLLVHVSTKGEPVYGFFIFFVLALGLGLPYLLLGTFSGAIKALPRSGEWMIAVRKVFGLVLIGMALYFLMPLMGAYVNYFFIAFFAGSALYLILWESGKASPKKFAWILRGIGVGAAAAAVIFALPKKIEAEIPWQPYSEQALAEAVKEGRPVVIDVFADWCIPCKELDKLTFTDSKVKSEATRFVTLKLNLTTNDPQTEAGRARRRFDIIGVPTIIFLDGSGREDSKLRLVGFEEPDLFLSRMKRMISSPGSDAGKVLAANGGGGGSGIVADAGSGGYESAPAVSLALLDGGKIDVESLRGKVVLIDFWATWCVPCLSEVPVFNELHKANRARGFELVAIALDDEGAEIVKPFVKAHPMNYTVALGDSELAQRFKVDDSVLPVTLLLDKQGRIRFTHVGVPKGDPKEVFEAEINQLLAE
jgi:thioredoxin:protein disulfide reductase